MRRDLVAREGSRGVSGVGMSVDMIVLRSRTASSLYTVEHKNQENITPTEKDGKQSEESL